MPQKPFSQKARKLIETFVHEFGEEAVLMEKMISKHDDAPPSADDVAKLCDYSIMQVTVLTKLERELRKTGNSPIAKQ